MPTFEDALAEFDYLRGGPMPDEQEPKGYDVYLAAPFFDDDQLAEVKAIEGLLEENGLTYFSPRKECRYHVGDPPEVANRAFLLNIQHVRKCKFVVALITFPDCGTSFELGLAKGYGKATLGITSNPKTKMNLMVRQTVHALVPINRAAPALGSIALDLQRGRESFGAINAVDFSNVAWDGEME